MDLHFNPFVDECVASASDDTTGALQCVALCCTVIQPVRGRVCCRVLQYVAVCCSVFQCVAVCLNPFVDECVAVYCSMLQCLVVCFSVLQCV